MFYKPEYRKSIRHRRKQLAPIAVQQYSSQIAAQLIYHPKMIEAKHIGFYLSQEGEVDPKPLVQTETMRQKLFYLPVVSKIERKLDFYAYNANDPLIENSYGILEPLIENKKPINACDLDVVLVPLVGFDENGNRLGRGAGYYDHTFAFLKTSTIKKPFLIGLAYDFQKIPVMDSSSWDIPMDIVITPTHIYLKKSAF